MAARQLCWPVANPGFTGGGADHGERGAQAYNGGPGAEPQRGLGEQPLVGAKGRNPLKLTAFCPFSYKRWAKN